MVEFAESAHEIVENIRRGSITCREVVERAQRVIDNVQPQFNAFTHVAAEDALNVAEKLDLERQSGSPLRLLHGVPICIKDMTPTFGHPTTYGSLAACHAAPNSDAVIVERLKAAGALIVAKTTTSELAFSSFTRSKRYGPTLNPWDTSRTSGGSSGGSAVAVSTGVAPLAEGTDMGGSVRIPAAACGVVGFKPSIGRIPMDILPSALDTISHFGPLGGCVADATLFMAATAGHHPSDMLSQRRGFSLAAAKPQSPKGRRIALSTNLGYCHVDDEVESSLLKTAVLLRRSGAIVEEIDLRWTREVYDQWAVHWNCLLALMAESFGINDLSLIDPALAQCIEIGRSTNAMTLIKVDSFRAKMNAQMNRVFNEFEALICPTNAIPAPKVNGSDTDYEVSLPSGKMRAFDMAHPFNMLSSSPVLSLPIGLTCERLPVGMQIVGRPYADEETLSLAGSIETVLDPLPKPTFLT